jgi:AcrR family transcriptional regulator
MDTRQRLLHAAGITFAERGFEHATIREICRRARANIAAVNYHFHGKQGLYAAVLTHGAKLALDAFPPDQGLGAAPSVDDELQVFIYSFLCRFLDAHQRQSWYARLCAREMVEPTAALDGVVRQIIRPLAEHLEGLVARRLKPRASKALVRRCSLSIVGQCLLHHFHRPVLERLYGPQRHTEADIRRLADHITAFSLAALRQMKETTHP